MTFREWVGFALCTIGFGVVWLGLRVGVGREEASRLLDRLDWYEYW